MAWIDPRYLEHQRKRFTRADAYRFAPPGTPEAKMPGYLHPSARIAAFERAQQEEAEREAAAQEGLQRELLELRRECEELKREFAARRAARLREVEALRRKSDLAWEQFFRTFKRYAAQQKAGFNPDQPRDDHGKWTDSGQDAGKDGDDRARSTDISAQRRLGPRPIGTPAQHARLDTAIANAREAIARVQQLQPNWRPQSATSFDNRSNIEVMIRAKEAETREAETRYVALASAGRDDSYLRRDAQTTVDVLRAEAAGRPMPGSGKDTRTVSSARFEELRLELMGGARRMGPDPEYIGVRYRRQDGSEIGLRISYDQGLTLDVLRSNDPVVPQGFRIHQR